MFILFSQRYFAILVIAMSVLITLRCEAVAQSSGIANDVRFDIPAQSLASSLKAFGVVAGLELYYESSLVDGHRSPSIHGSFSPEAALRRLLEGTGLAVQSFEPGTLTILASRQPANAHNLVELKSRAAEFTPYFALIQAGLRAVFCQTPAVQTGSEELIVRLWISPSGAVARAEILPSTGSEERDRVYAAALRSLVIGQAPPQRMPQPVTLMVLPRASRTAAECSQLGNARPVRASVDE